MRHLKAAIICGFFVFLRKFLDSLNVELDPFFYLICADGTAGWPRCDKVSEQSQFPLAIKKPRSVRGFFIYSTLVKELVD